MVKRLDNDQEGEGGHMRRSRNDDIVEVVPLSGPGSGIVTRQVDNTKDKTHRILSIYKLFNVVQATAFLR
jgi:hypothetical protein